jgi:glucose-1-phosphate thymidylyltransferase
MLMLGDNLLYGRLDFLRDAVRGHGDDAAVFAYRVSNPSEYGIVEFDRDGTAIGIEEKPAHPRSNWAVPGIYLYPPGAAARVREQQPSARGELEITDLNRSYLSEGRLRVVPMGRGVAWFDTGTPNQLLEASNFIEAIESRQGLAVGSPEEIAFRMGFLDEEQLAALIDAMPSGPYSEYVARLLEPETVRAFDAR